MPKDEREEVMRMSFHDYRLHSLEGKEVSLSDYEGKVVVAVNVASKCGFTYQYEALEKLHEDYKDKDVVVLGFPCNQFAGQEPGDSEEIRTFCTLNYGVTFPLFEKIDVRGETAHPLYKWLISQRPYEGMTGEKAAMLLGHIEKNLPPDYLKDDEIKWNFTKFVIGRDGQVLRRFEPPAEGGDVAKFLESIL